MTGTRHAGFPQDGDSEVEARLVEAETGDLTASPIPGAERERLEREARRAYQESGGVTGGSAADDVTESAEEVGDEEDGVSETSGAGAADGVEEPDDLAHRLVEVSRERDEYLDSLRRVQADFENYRKRVMREQSVMSDRAAEVVVEKLLPVLDTVDLAHRHAAAGRPVEDAVGMIAAGLAEALARAGLERIDPEGEAFDPAQHEAVAHEPGGGPDAPVAPQVVEVMRAGYRWKGRVLRPAMVKVRG